MPKLKEEIYEYDDTYTNRFITELTFVYFFKSILSALKLMLFYNLYHQIIENDIKKMKMFMLLYLIITIL